MHNYENGALLRIEPVKPLRDNTLYECLAENGVGDAVLANAQLKAYEGTYYNIFQPGFFIGDSVRQLPQVSSIQTRNFGPVVLR